MGCDQIAALIHANALAFFRDDVEQDSWERTCRGSRNRRCRTGQRRDHYRTRLGLPPRVDDRTAALSDRLVIPHPCFRIYGLTDRTEQPQAGEIMLQRMLLAP